MWIESDAGVAIDRHARGACSLGEAGCATYCFYQGKHHGGCCGENYTKCLGTCYCNGSGYEYRCHSCDL
uniref:Defensin gallicin n=1 Tax=Mytilus galloprovincialis TaxID=29158 RepID=DEFGA_MYTGA|nr:RecName: Full=Defensin gallicin; Flags: Precursor [Mytilus galloprovincialis]